MQELQLGAATPVQEKQRIYHYANGVKIVLNKVTELIVQLSGTHRIKADNKLWIIPEGWIAIEIDSDEWVV